MRAVHFGGQGRSYLSHQRVTCDWKRKKRRGEKEHLPLDETLKKQSYTTNCFTYFIFGKLSEEILPGMKVGVKLLNVIGFFTELCLWMFPPSTCNIDSWMVSRICGHSVHTFCKWRKCCFCWKINRIWKCFFRSNHKLNFPRPDYTIHYFYSTN